MKLVLLFFCSLSVFCSIELDVSKHFNYIIVSKIIDHLVCKNFNYNSVNKPAILQTLKMFVLDGNQKYSVH